MLEIASEPANFTLYQSGSKYLLATECGTTAVYDLKIELNDEEMLLYTQKGLDFIRSIADDVRTWPDRYAARRL